MSRQAAQRVDATLGCSRPLDPALTAGENLYGELCSLATLEKAFEHVRALLGNRSGEPIGFEAAGPEVIRNFLEQLRNELRARTYQPRVTSHFDTLQGAFDGGNRDVMRRQVVSAALKLVLDGILEADRCSPSDTEEAIRWVAGGIDKGLTRVYRLNIAASLETLGRNGILRVLGERVRDPGILGLLQSLVNALVKQESAQQRAGTADAGCQEMILADTLTNIAFYGIDQMLQQANALGNHETCLTLKCRRFRNDVVIISAPAKGSDWVLPAVERRLREELQLLTFELNAANTQFVDMERDRTLTFLGFELRYLADKQGGSRVRYKRVENSGLSRSNPTSPSPAPTRRRRHLAFTGLSSKLGRHSRTLAYAAGLILFTGLVGLVALFTWRPAPADLFRYEQFTRPSGEKVNYAIYVPADYNPGKRYPLIVFLHGYGERGTDGRKQCTVGMGLGIRWALQRGDAFDFVVLFPQGKAGVWLPGSNDDMLVSELADNAIARLNVDPDRVYLTGLSSGGTGVWNLAAAHPDRWAAILPLCSFPATGLIPKVKALPCWCFHGELDSVQKTQAFITELEKAGGRARFTVLPSTGHKVWNQVYLNREVYEWLSAQRRER
jgi:Putative esterase